MSPVPILLIGIILVVATLSTHHRRAFIKHEGGLIKPVPFPFTGRIIDLLC